MRMRIPQISDLIFRQLKQMITFAFLSQPIVPPQNQQKYHRTNTRDPKQPKTCAVPSTIVRRLRSHEDITRDKPATIPKPDLHCRCNSFLVVATHIIAKPANEDWLRDIAAANDSVQSKIFDAR